MEKNFVAIKSEVLSNRYDIRFVIIDKETGEILDDAQGFGYKTPPKAYAAYNYKKSDKKKRLQKDEQVKKWMKEHKDFVRAMDAFAFEIAKGSWGPDAKFNAAFVKKMLADNGLELNCTVGDLLRVWKNRKK